MVPFLRLILYLASTEANSAHEYDDGYTSSDDEGFAEGAEGDGEPQRSPIDETGLWADGLSPYDRFP